MVACWIALLSLQLGQDIFVSKPQGRKRLKEVCQEWQKNRRWDSIEIELAFFFFSDRKKFILFVSSSSCTMSIVKIHAREIFDSRGNPTVEVDLHTDKGKQHYE